MPPTYSVNAELAHVRRQLDEMSEWRLISPFTAEEEEMYHMLLGRERMLMDNGYRPAYLRLLA